MPRQLAFLSAPQKCLGYYKPYIQSLQILTDCINEFKRIVSPQLVRFTTCRSPSIYVEDSQIRFP